MVAAPKIALIHATPLAMAPVAAAFDEVWPQAKRMNLLDDSLSQDLALAGQLDDAMTARFYALASYAKACGADAILFTCSAFGPAIESVKQSIGLPVLNPNEAMFAEALALCRAASGPQPVVATAGLLTTFGPSAAPLIQEFEATARLRGNEVGIEAACASGAMEALSAGDAPLHDQLILRQVPALAHCKVLMLGQFSMARAQPVVARASGLPVLTSPLSAVQSLRKLLG
jgi:Asp/Glu/Hydantoin racemase